MTQPKLAVIQFPGSNCEYETARATNYYGFKTDIIRWTTDAKTLANYDAFILPGGFSYQDRIRAGVIASKLPLITALKNEAEKGKLILGICNGCQILAEAGFFPNLEKNFQIEVALAPNTQEKNPVGFICEWVYVKPKNSQLSPFTKLFNDNDIIPIPINHGEGRFVLNENSELALNKLSHFQYCDSNGEIIKIPPVNLNGSFNNLAGLCNLQGNVLAIMPHPERASFLKQIPTFLSSIWSDKKINNNDEKDGPWGKMFLSMIKHIKDSK